MENKVSYLQKLAFLAVFCWPVLVGTGFAVGQIKDDLIGLALFAGPTTLLFLAVLPHGAKSVQKMKAFLYKRFSTWSDFILNAKSICL